MAVRPRRGENNNRSGRIRFCRGAGESTDHNEKKSLSVCGLARDGLETVHELAMCWRFLIRKEWTISGALNRVASTASTIGGLMDKESRRSA